MNQNQPPAQPLAVQAVAPVEEANASVVPDFGLAVGNATLIKPNGEEFVVQVNAQNMVQIFHAVQQCFQFDSEKQVSKKINHIRSGMEDNAMIKLMCQTPRGQKRIMNCASPESVQYIIGRIHKQIRGKNITPQHENLVASIKEHLPRLQVSCARCTMPHIIDLASICAHNDNVEIRLNHWMQSRVASIEIDLALVDKETGLVQAAVEVHYSSRVTDKKKHRFEVEQIPWCEIDARKVDLETVPNAEFLVCEQGSLCEQCNMLSSQEDSEEDDDEMAHESNAQDAMSDTTETDVPQRAVHNHHSSMAIVPSQGNQPTHDISTCLQRFNEAGADLRNSLKRKLESLEAAML